MAGKNPPRGGEGSASPWDLKQIQELIDLLIEREISEFEMEKGGLRIRIKRGNAHNPGPGPASSEISTAASAPAVSPPAPPLPSLSRAPAESPGADTAEDLHLIRSPIVGTFYASPAPNAPPFVKLGEAVEVGRVLCVIEAMKLMNDIESEVAGEVIRIYVENGQPVEYGQPLFAIKPSNKK